MKKNDFILLFIIIIVAAFLRFYNLSERVALDWDQENFAWQAKEMIFDKKFTLIGAQTSVGGMYLGPLYTYISNLFYFIFQMNPIAGPVLSVCFGLLTIAALYVLNLSLFSRGVAIISALFYTFSFSMIEWDQIAWNPAAFYLYTLLTLYVFLKSLKNIKYLPALSLLLGLGLHFHLVSITFFPLIVFPFFNNNKRRIRYALYSFLTFLLAVSPLIIFDLRHNFHNVNQLINFLSQQRNSFGNNGFQFKIIAEMISEGAFSFLLSEIPFKIKYLLIPFLWLSVLITYLFSPIKIRKILSALFLLGIINFLFFSIYPGLVLGYYLMVFPPLAIILFSLFSQRLYSKNIMTKIILLAIFATFLFTNFSTWRQYERNISLKDKEDVVDFIIKDAQEKPFRVSLTTAMGYDTGYRYLLWYRKANLSTDIKDKVYTIVAPNGVYGIKAFREFHEVGVLWEDGQKI